MNAQEAIRRIKKHNEVHRLKEHNAIFITAALDMAVEVLEKQIPQRPLNFGDKEYLCPTCRRNNFYDGTEILNKTNFCNYCGQALDWSGEE